MNHLKTKLAGIGLAFSMVLVPVNTGAEAPANHRISTQEMAGQAAYEPHAGYMPLDRTPLERIAGRDNLDSETIRFLENNLWDYDFLGYAVGGPDSPAAIYPSLEDVVQQRAGELNY